MPSLDPPDDIVDDDDAPWAVIVNPCEDCGRPLAHVVRADQVETMLDLEYARYTWCSHCMETTRLN